MNHRANAAVVGGQGTSRKTYRPKCRTCGWQGTNTTSKTAATKEAMRHEGVAR